MLLPNEEGAVACVVSSVRSMRLPRPHGALAQDGLVDLPFPSRVMGLTPIGTLKARLSADGPAFEIRRGVDVFPSVGAPVRLPTVEELGAIVEGEVDVTRRVLVGCCPTAARAPVYIDPDKLFGRHLAVLGNTGAGKSCSVAGLVRWSLEEATKIRQKQGKKARPNARFIVLDPNGEYARAFQDLGVRLYRVEPDADSESLRVPAWLWNGAEWGGVYRRCTGSTKACAVRCATAVAFRAWPTRRAANQGKESHRPISDLGSKCSSKVASTNKEGCGKGVAEVLLNIHKDFDDLANEPGCSDVHQRAFKAVAARAMEVEEGAQQRGGRQKTTGGYWHSDFSEAEIGTVAVALRDAANAVGLDDFDAAATDEGTPLQFPLGELAAYVDALAADRSGRDMVQFVDTLNLRIRSLLATNTLRSILDPVDVSFDFGGLACGLRRC